MIKYLLSLLINTIFYVVLITAIIGLLWWGLDIVIFEVAHIFDCSINVVKIIYICLIVIIFMFRTIIHFDELEKRR